MALLQATPDGWLTEPTLFHFFMDHAPPRPWGYWDQVCVDARCPKIVAMWTIGLGCTVAALTTGHWVLLLIGLSLLWLWVHLCRVVVHDKRTSPVTGGVIDQLTPHPLAPMYTTATATLQDGEQMLVALENEFVAAPRQGGLPAAVLLFGSQTARYKSVFAVKPIQATNV